MSNTASYQAETHNAYIGLNEITVIGLTPIFSSEEEQLKNKRNIEHSLYRIFERYSRS